MKVLFAVLAALALLPSVARAEGSDALTRGAFGHGTVVASSSPAHPAPVCSTPASNPASHEVDCAPIAAWSFGSCPPPGGGSGNCGISLTAQAAVGWAFDHWSGGKCSGTNPICSFTTVERICTNPELGCDLHMLGPWSVIANFVDTRAPTVTLAGGPAENAVVVDDSRHQAFTFTTNEDDEAPTYGCRLDGTPTVFAACASPRLLDGLTDGVHDFCVRAADASGVLSANPACRHWEQQTRPTATLTGHPDAVANSSSAAFAFVSNKTERVSFECGLDGSAFAACSSARFDGLADGAHHFAVRAIFRGALDAPTVRRVGEATTFDWVIDTTAPETTITDGPVDGSVISDIAPTFTFAAGEPGSTFTCSVDGAPAASCASPFTLPILASGAHTLSVAATDPVGNVDATPAIRRFSLAVLVPAPIDRDRDGYSVKLDCDDGNAAINPGAREVPGNRVDEDCDGVAAPFPKLLSPVTNSGSAGAKSTVFTAFVVTEIPVGAKVELRCSAPRKAACPFTRRVPKIAKGTANVLTSAAERRHGLKVGVGATLDVRIVAPEAIGRVRRYKIVRSVYPKGSTLCLPPGKTRPAAC